MKPIVLFTTLVFSLAAASGALAACSDAAGIEVNWTGCDKANANLTGAVLAGAHLDNANLRNATLRNADMRFAQMTSADLRGADLSYADLRYANLTNTDLSQTYYEFADFSHAWWKDGTTCATGSIGTCKLH